MAMTLRELAIGETGRVVGFDKSRRGYRQKLLAMGLTPGTDFTVTRLAPLGDPVEIRVRGFALSLRKDEADTLLVEKQG
jgi:ferrous iron transport protein A